MVGYSDSATDTATANRVDYNHSGTLFMRYTFKISILKTTLKATTSQHYEISPPTLCTHQSQ